MNTKQLARDLIVNMVVLLGIGGLVYTFRSLIGPLVVAALLAYLLYPGVTWMVRRTPLERRQIVPLVYMLFLVVVILALVTLFPVVLKQAGLLSLELQHIPVILVGFEEDLRDLLGLEIPLFAYWAELQTDATQFLKPEKIFRVLQNAGTNIFWVVIVVATSFYLLRDWERLREWIFGLFPGEYQSDARHLHQEIKLLWKTYLRGQLMIMFLLAIFSGLGAALIGLPNAILLGILAGALALIPTLGPATATILAAVIAWTQGSTFLPISNIAMTLLAVVVFQIVQAVEGIWLTPQIMGRRLQLHPGLVLVAVVGSLVIVGATMALVVVPLIGSMGILVRYLSRKRAGLDPWPVELVLQSDDSDQSG
jgi:predicted PurR-regulated permease PerM